MQFTKFSHQFALKGLITSAICAVFLSDPYAVRHAVDVRQLSCFTQHIGEVYTKTHQTIKCIIYEEPHQDPASLQNRVSEII
jgi:hypothetical protein